MPSISVVIITLNEEKNIRRCLESVQGVADEIIIVDSSSTDQTVSICKEFGAKVFEKEWMGYGAKKNFGNQNASHPYILSLDADEALSPVLNKMIRDIKGGLQGAYTVNRLTQYCGQWIRHSGWYPDKKIRLFPKESAKWTLDLVHETLELEKGLGLIELCADLHHYSYYSVAEHQTRSKKYAHLAAVDLAKKNKLVLLIKSLFGPAFRFLKSLLFQMGFKDGKNGWIIGYISARETWIKYSRALIGATPK